MKNVKTLNRISLYSRIRGVNIKDALHVLQLFGTVRHVVFDSIGTVCPFFISNAQELFDGDDFCHCNQYEVCTPEDKKYHIALYYGNVSEKVVDFQLY